MDREKERENAQDDFLSTDLDTLSGIVPSRKKKYNGKLKLSQEEKKRVIQNSRKKQERNKQGKSSGGRKNFSFLAKGLDEI